MKTPKEKAKELVDLMLNEQSHTQEIYDAKQCALIAVDELIKLYEILKPHRGFKISYWDEVKQELEKL